MDIIGEILWWSAFFTPVITIPIALKFSKSKKIIRIVKGLLIAIGISIVFLFISITILFRNGLGPT